MDDLDEIDIKILHLLQADARMTNKEMAAKLDLSITPIFERVRKLEKRGYITNYAAIVNPYKVNLGMIVFLTLRIAQHKSEIIKKVEQEVALLPEVMECYHIAGEDDYLLKVMVKDMTDYEHFVVDKLTKIENIGHVRSNFVMSVVKHKTALEIKK